MSLEKNFARRFRSLRVLRASLAVGGLFNLILGALLGLMPAWATALLNIPRPVPGFYLQVLALLVALLGCYYLLAASNLRRYSGNVAIAIMGRLTAGLVLLLAAASDPSLASLKLLAAVDIGFGTVHAISWWSARP